MQTHSKNFKKRRIYAEFHPVLYGFRRQGEPIVAEWKPCSLLIAFWKRYFTIMLDFPLPKGNAAALPGRGRHFARRRPCILAADQRHPVSHHCRCDQCRLAQVQEGRDLVVGISSGARVREYEQYLAPARWDRAHAVGLRGECRMLELYRTAIGTLQGIAWMPLAFFTFTQLAFVIVRFAERVSENGSGPEGLRFPSWKALHLVFFGMARRTIMYQLEVCELTCGHCVAAVTKAVQGIDAAAKVDVDLTQRKVSVESSAPLERVSAAIEDAGYPVFSKAAV